VDNNRIINTTSSTTTTVSKNCLNQIQIRNRIKSERMKGKKRRTGTHSLNTETHKEGEKGELLQQPREKRKE